MSFETPEYTANSDALGTLRLLEALRILGVEKQTRFYQASTSELYGKVQETPQTEKDAILPAQSLCHRQALRLLDHGKLSRILWHTRLQWILFNHEGPTRGETFVTRKITRAVSAIHHGFEKRLYLGNLDAKRDWGLAREYVEGMWLMLHSRNPTTMLLATGETHTVRDFVELAFAEIGKRISWRGATKMSKGSTPKTGEVLVAIDPR